MEGIQPLFLYLQVLHNSPAHCRVKTKERRGNDREQEGNHSNVSIHGPKPHNALLSFVPPITTKGIQHNLGQFSTQHSKTPSINPGHLLRHRLHELPYNSSDHHGLPPDTENTDALPPQLVTRFIESSKSLKPHFTSLLHDLVHGRDRPLAVVADIFFGWSAEVAHELGLFHATFSLSGGFALACYYSTLLNLPHRKTDSPEFSLPDFPEAGKLHVNQLGASIMAADGSDSWSIFQRENLPAW